MKDKVSGEDLIGANVYIKEIYKGTISNFYGFYSLTLPKGNYSIIVSFLGYQIFEKEIVLDKNLTLNFNLDRQNITTKEVTIFGEGLDKNVKSAEMSTIYLPVEAVKSLPAFMGEVDILKIIQLLPGVQSAGEGSTGFYVRGGGPDQNLILLDGATVYNASHLFGFFSIFNADAIKNVNLIKGGMPANYGGRLSSVLDISMKEGNNHNFEVDGGIGVISSRLTVQGPIINDTSSFIISARRTYIDVLINPFIKKTAQAKGSGYYFYDLNAKVNYRFSDKDRIFLSGYFGRDVFTFKNKDAGFNVTIPWGNATTSLRWNHVFNNKLFSNATAIYSDYQFEFAAEQADFEFKLFSGITDINLKLDFTYIQSIRHNFKFGTNYTYHTFTPSGVTGRIGETVLDAGKIKNQYANELAFYVNDEFDLTEKLKLIAGFRFTYYNQIGPFDRYIKNDDWITTDTIVYKKGEKIVDYLKPEPRLSLRYILKENSSIKFSFTQNYQYVHLASVSSATLPTDLWVPSTSIVKPQFGIQYAIGYFKNFDENMFESSVELYYKKLENLIEYKDGATPDEDVGDNSDNNFTFGDGESYGLEFFLKKRFGTFTGWVGYTLAKTTRTFAEINSGETFPTKYDRRHDLSIITTNKLNEKWSVSFIFIYATGNALTLPVSRYLMEGQINYVYGKRNSYRMDAYHRADISVEYISKKTDKYVSSWNFSIYNLYNRMNPYFIYFDNEGSIEELTWKTSAKQVSLFPILPSVAWNFKF